MNEGLEQRFTLPSPIPADGSFNESAPLRETEIQFTPREQELLAKLIAEGKSEAIQIAEYDAKFGPPKGGYYPLESSLITPHQIDELIRSLKKRNIHYTDLPEEALFAIQTLGLLEHFESGLVSAVTEKNIKEGVRVLSAPLFFDRDDSETLYNYTDKERSAEIQKNFYAQLIHRIGVSQEILAPRPKDIVLEQNLTSIDIDLFCDSIVNFVKKSGSSFEELFPNVPEELHVFIYKKVEQTRLSEPKKPESLENRSAA
ncbi:MAG: hypothetical protein A3B90_01485 [Candidatus Magasanikbacteria bacterium RIFCSPHIGHO2_02_FULL_41_13]|uniref:Uncharacterized protein n=1 Tax=Candidatus Magasanikbacteria bacterium RIFCSPHIGHO2_02_FULL_41_13 TaxID=1798676 RepID=A0A1F6M4J0_9BACT|nr:MAG: hypothetical protein A3B90_01485 [Candidatus Magasanikbacteria bacterium RIFCSPHIGHO2_02_FULL_41_13]